MNLLIVAKRPVPGRAKTRLLPAFGAAGSAALAAAALADTFDAARRSSATRVVVAFDGDPTGVVPTDFEVIPQCSGDLSARLARAWRAMTGPTLQVGMDTPQVTGDDLDQAFAALCEPGTDAVLGLADDGGWWAVGLRRPTTTLAGALFTGIATSQADTGSRQLGRLRQLGLATTALPTRRDVDHPADVEAVAAEARDTRFGRVALELLASVAPGGASAS